MDPARKQRARDAMQNRDKDQKMSKAVEYLEHLWFNYGYAGKSDTICTLGMIYNATGDTINFVNNHSWAGAMVPETDYNPASTKVRNGEWHCFLHHETSHVKESAGAVVYRINDLSGLHYDVVQAWDTRGNHDNKCHTEIGHQSAFAPPRIHLVKENMDKSKSSVEDMSGHGYRSSIRTGAGNSPIVEGIITLANIEYEDIIVRRRRYGAS